MRVCIIDKDHTEISQSILRKQTVCKSVCVHYHAVLDKAINDIGRSSTSKIRF